MNDWPDDDFDDYWHEDGRSNSRTTFHYILAATSGVFFACILIFILFRWSVSAPILQNILSGNVPAPTETEIANTSDETFLAIPQTSVPVPNSTPIPTAISGTTPNNFPLQTTTAPTPSIRNSDPTLHPPNLTALQEQMLDAINADRATKGLNSVSWDGAAALAGQLHAEDMLVNDYFSHWNLYGYGPEHRYALTGGQDIVFENLHTYRYRYDDGRPAPIEDWPQLILDADTGLMNSPGHRRTILDPDHTHVGIGIAYDPAMGEMRLAQEFINRYVAMEPVPQHLSLDDSVIIKGRLLSGATNPLINLAYSPFPTPMSSDNMPAGSYKDGSEIYQAITPDTRGDVFESVVSFNYQGQSGIYVVRVWIEVNEEIVPASELIFWID